MLTQSERACLVIADISGYTSYLAGTEIDHAQDVLADLMEVVIARIGPVLRLAKLEGDAVFTYALEANVDGSMLLDAVENCYFAFRRRLQSIRQASTCQCNACVLIPNLNLKFCVHDGPFVRQRIAGQEELAGSAVILVHRLLKNSVAHTLGLKGYGLLTTDAVEALKIAPAPHGMREHREAYEYFGEVLTYVHDLQARWKQEQELRRDLVAPEEADMKLEFTFPAPPPLVWEYMTSPVKRPVWAPGVTGFDQQNPSGRRGVGTTNHCVHGKDSHLEEILDWRPFDSFTWLMKMPGLGDIKITTHLLPTDGGTRLRSYSRLESPELRAMLENPEQRGMLEQMGTELERDFRGAFTRLAEVLAEEMAGRKEDLAAAAEARAKLRAQADHYWAERQAAGQVDSAPSSSTS